MTRYFHTTDAAEAILRDGFRDGEGSYMMANTVLRGVFLANTPLDINEGAVGDQVLAVDLDTDLDRYELVEVGKPYREWCVPAELVNAQGRLTLLSDEELEEIAAREFEARFRE